MVESNQPAPQEPSVPQPFGYVTFAADGSLDGSFFQVPPAGHVESIIPVDEDVRASWVLYRANDARDGVELAPPAPPAPPQIPQTVTMRQARLALLGAGVLAQIEAAIAGMPHPEQDVARIEWDYGKDVERNSPTVALLAGALSLDDAALDQLFITAAGL